MKIRSYVGASQDSKIDRELVISNPASLDQQVGVIEFCDGHLLSALDRAVQKSRSRGARDSARKLELANSALRFLNDHAERIHSVLMAETGRTKGDFELELRQTRRYLQALSENLSAGESLEPRGVAALVLSSVWPVFHSLQFVIANLWVGNSVIVKPAVGTSAVVSILFEGLRQKSELWNEVLILLGDSEMGRRLVVHGDVDLVLFQGSYEAGMRVRQDTLSQAGKEVLLFLGARNPVILLEPENPKHDSILLQDAFLGAGQNCRSASLVLVPENAMPEYLARIEGKVRSLSFGPLSEATRLDRYLKHIAVSEREGARMVLKGRASSSPGESRFVTPTLAAFADFDGDRMKKSVSLQTEILAPHLSVLGFRDPDQAREILSNSSYGHSCGILGGTEREHAEFRELKFGFLCMNGSLLEVDPWACAQTFKRSGSHASYGAGLFRQVGRERVLEAK